MEKEDPAAYVKGVIFGLVLAVILIYFSLPEIVVQNAMRLRHRTS